MVSGGDGYSMIPDNLVEHRNTGFLDGDLIVSYLKKNDPVRAPAPGRIVILDRARTSSASSLMTPTLQQWWAAVCLGMTTAVNALMFIAVA